MISNHKIISLLLHNCNFAPVIKPQRIFQRVTHVKKKLQQGVEIEEGLVGYGTGNVPIRKV